MLPKYVLRFLNCDEANGKGKKHGSKKNKDKKKDKNAAHKAD